LNDVEKQSGTKDATILMVFGGVFLLYLGITMFQLSIIIPNPFQTIPGIVMVVLGLLTFCVSLVIWLQKSWVIKIISVVGVSVCVTLFIFGYFYMIIIIASIHWFAIKWIRTSQPTEIPDWAPDWNED